MENDDVSFNKFPIGNMKGIHFINLNELMYVKSDGCYANFNMIKGVKNICSSHPLGEWETMLPHSKFIRISNTHILNIHFVAEYHKGKDGSVILLNREELTVSRTYKEAFLALMHMNVVVTFKPELPLSLPPATEPKLLDPGLPVIKRYPGTPPE
jgi:DNA-binding LytR/AlgR family response regulator